jgi:Protein of unknown function (DUF4089)
MTDRVFDPDALIDAAAPLLGLEIKPAYRPMVKIHLETAAKMAALMQTVELPDDAEPSPVFRA